MERIPLIGGAYEARSLIADAQRCVNLYPEKNPEGAGAPYTYYPTPGLVKLARTPTNLPWRGLRYASNGQLFGVAGRNVYYINEVWALTKLGEILTTEGPVSLQDNTVELSVSDGTANTYLVNLATHAFSLLVDPTGLFQGATTAIYLDGFVVFNKPRTKTFYSTLNTTYTFDGTYFAQKTTKPDLLKAVAAKQQELWLLGERTSEVWYNAGNPAFPFQRLPGTLLEFGVEAVGSIARDPIGLYFLAVSDQGRKTVLRLEQYEPQRISTYAIEAAIQSYPRTDDAVGTSYLIGGHLFYELTFPTAEKTWVWDQVEQLWHEKAWYDPASGQLTRSRVNCHALAYGTNVVGDFENGWLYRLDSDVYTDFDGPVVRLRSFAHLGANGNRVSYSAFMANMQVGQGTLDVTLRWSDTRGYSWGIPVKRRVAVTGDYLAAPTWWNLGMARDRVFELSWSSPVETALQGAFIELEAHET